MDKKLDCCVVRDLLPAYIEELTEGETSAQVKSHLEGCEGCQTLERDMRAQVPVEKVPKGALNFLKRVKRTRLIAAGVTLVLALWCIWWLYDVEFHYANTEAGRLAAVEDYITQPADSTMNHDLKAGTPFRVIAWQEARGKLFIFYGADNRDNVHGIIQLTRGVNGKYRTDEATMDPFPYTAGIMARRLDVRKTDWSPIAIAGDNCREIYSIAVEYTWFDEAERREVMGRELTYPVSEVNFFWLLEEEDVREQLGASSEVRPRDVRYLDKGGNDITGQYRDDSVEQNWSGGKSTAEQELLYVYIGIVAALSWVFIRYFLRKD